MTIAAIQRNYGGTTGAFRNEALFEWLKSKCPLQEIVSSINKQTRVKTGISHKLTLNIAFC